jgi:hypothetical protein
MEAVAQTVEYLSGLMRIATKIMSFSIFFGSPSFYKWLDMMLYFVLLFLF